jgi:hypothetical protein
MATPLLTATPGTPPTYNPGMAETFSWIPVEGAGRPLFAQASYIANPEDIKLSLSANNINVSLDQLELNTDEIEGLIINSNLRLDSLTAVNYSTSANQDLTNTLLNVLTASTDNVEELIIDSNTRLNVLTAVNYSTSANQDLTNTNLSALQTDLNFEFNQTQTILNSLTALQKEKQDLIITLLDQLTANTDEIEGLIFNTNTKLDVLSAVDYSTGLKQDLTNTLLDGLTGVDYSTSVKQDLTNTLLNVLTASTDSLENNTDMVEVKIDTVIGLLSAQLGQQGFDFIVGGETATGTFTTVQIASAAKISAISANSSTIGQLTAFELPANFSFNGPITSITLAYGAAFVYKL